MKPLRKSAPVAFTLIELLVVIAVIAILAALLLPSLSRAKAAALSAACKNDLHQMGVALKLYADENQAFPVWLDGVYWDARLLPLAANNRNLFICPGVRPAPIWTNNPATPTVNPCYGYNVSGTAGEGIQDPKKYLGEAVLIEMIQSTKIMNKVRLIRYLPIRSRSRHVSARWRGPYAGPRHTVLFPGACSFLDHELPGASAIWDGSPAGRPRHLIQAFVRTCQARP